LASSGDGGTDQVRLEFEIVLKGQSPGLLQRQLHLRRRHFVGFGRLVRLDFLELQRLDLVNLPAGDAELLQAVAIGVGVTTRRHDEQNQRCQRRPREHQGERSIHA
jgi:hypothetical protein